MCYIYLCAGRYVQEEPYFVRGVLHLMEDHKIGFFTAFCLASYYQTSNSGHHILPFSRDYKTSQTPATLNAPIKGGFGNSFDMIHAARLAEFVSGGDKGKSIKDMSVPLRHVNLHGELQKCFKNNKKTVFHIERGDIKSKRLESILKSGEFDKPLFV
jgi:hypothetical protein